MVKNWETDALDGCTQGALGVGELGRADTEGDDPPDELAALPRPKPGRRSRFVGEAAGYPLHAGVAVPGKNRLGRELLFRYCARPPVPPPRSPLIRFHGVFAPHSKKRVLVVPGDAAAGLGAPRETKHEHGERREQAARPPVAAPGGESRRAEAGAAAAPKPAGGSAAVRATTSAEGAEGADEGDPEPSRIHWATLLRRVYDVDALACPCGGRLALLELVTDATDIRTVLERLGLDDEPPESGGEARIRGP